MSFAPRLVSIFVLLALAVSACGGDSTATDAAPAPDAMPPNPCTLLDPVRTQRAWSDGPYGTHRGDLAEDFTVPLLGGGTFNLRERWSGCDSYIFIPDTLPISQLDSTSIWERDLEYLVDPALGMSSPKNVHYFFVSRQGSDGAAETATTAMQARIDTTLDDLSAADADWWRGRLHVVADRAGKLDGWLRDPLASGIGQLGLAIDVTQRVRGVGSLSDVFFQFAAPMGVWPWEANIGYAGREADYYNAQADLYDRLAAEGATVVTLWEGEVLSEFAETDAIIPTAAELASFDTLEIEITMACPNADAVEFGNCGAWDYLAALYVRVGDADVEMARFITAYHRETHWVVDATPALYWLREGGMQHFRWSFAYPWNPQPTATKISLRFSNRSKGYAPLEVVPLYGGGSFDSLYNDNRLPIGVAIPSDAVRVELVALVTGHGADVATHCAEFCNHQHEFTVDGHTHMKDYPQAGTIAGCVAEAANGITPNQYGTWWYGRGGWCPGEQVTPWVVDVTSEITPGETSTVSYRGLYQGDAPPDPAPTTDFPASITMESWLVIYR